MVFLVVGFELGFSVIAGIILGEYVDKVCRQVAPNKNTLVYNAGSCSRSYNRF